MNKKGIIVRQIEEKDKGNYLRLFNSEDFGCIGINSNLKPTIYEEEKILNGVIDKTILSTAILVIEENNEFIGYASISRPSENNYHIGQFVIRKEKQRQGYGHKLMSEIKKYAAADKCDIKLECISTSQKFFQKQGFIKKSLSSFYYPRRIIMHKPKTKLFVDYKLIEEERIINEQQEMQHFEKFLKSPLFNEIMKL